MKKLTKLLPVCAGLIALASCSNDDFLSKNIDVDLSDKVVLKVTNGDDDITTRAYQDNTSKQTPAWGQNDVVRVYDGKLQAYDTFEYVASDDEDGSYYFAFQGEGDPYVDVVGGKRDYQYVLYGADEISYAGWKDGKNIALLSIQKEYDYEKVTVDENTALYKSIMPQFGVVKNVNEDGDVKDVKDAFYATMYQLTASVKVTFKNAMALKPAKVRVRSMLKSSTFGTYESKMVENAPLSDYSKGVTEPTAKSNRSDIALTGWFEAVLDKDIENDPTSGGLQRIEGGPVNQNLGYTITANINSAFDTEDECMVFFPIVPGTYDVLLFEYSIDGDNWNLIRYFTNYTFARNFKGSAKTLTTSSAEEASATIVGKGADTDKTDQIGLEDILNEYKDADYDVVVDVNSGEKPVAISVGAATSMEGYRTLNVPNLKHNVTLNIHGVLGTAKNTLTISGNEEGDGVLTINYLNETAVTSPIVIDTKAKVALLGAYGQAITANSATNLKLNGDFNNDVKIGNVGDLTLGGTFTKAVTSLANASVTGDVNVNAIFPEKGLALTTGTESHINVVPTVPTADQLTENENYVVITSEDEAINLNGGEYKSIDIVDETKTVNVGAITIEGSEERLTEVAEEDAISISAKSINFDMTTTSKSPLYKNVALNATEAININKALCLAKFTKWTTTGATTINGAVTVVSGTTKDETTWSHSGGALVINNGITTVGVTITDGSAVTTSNGFTVTNLTLTDAATVATIGGAVTTLNVNAAKSVAISAAEKATTIGTMNVNDYVSGGITLTGGATVATISKLYGYQAEEGQTVKATKITSKGKAAITNVYNNTPANLTFVSSSTSVADAVTFGAANSTTLNIYTGAQLAGLMNVEASTVAKTVTFNLHADVTLSGSFTGIKMFADNNNATTTVIFNGNNHKITSLKSDAAKANTSNAGFFTKLANANGNVTVKDLTFASPNITSTYADNCGIIVGSNAANLTISNVTVTKGTVSGNSTVGGLVGENTGSVTIDGATNVALSTAKGDWHVGGLVGRTTGNVTIGGTNDKVIVNVTKFASKTAVASYAPDHTPNAATTQAGTFGNLIGNINSAEAIVTANVDITNNLDDDMKSDLKFSKAFDNTYVKVVFVGSTNNEIGYSPKVGTDKVTIGTTTFKANDGEGGDAANTINHFVVADK